MNVFFFISLDNLLIDYQFTFSLLQEDDQHHTAINFMATPEEVSEFASCSQTKWFDFELSVLQKKIKIAAPKFVSYRCNLRYSCDKLLHT